MREGGCWVIEILETGCWILDKDTHLNTQRPLQETLLRNHKQKIFSSNPLRKWVNKVKVADWKIPGDIKKRFQLQTYWAMKAHV